MISSTISYPPIACGTKRLTPFSIGRDVIGVPLPAHCLDMQPDNSSIFFNELPSITGFPDFT
ncbi:hypothetical protein DU445_20400 [Shigella dysenteriae]|nr:hypothetical protein [Escherichia coli]EFQ0036063.1 hypothetical protein [Shigella dysenteriae]EFV9746025.1 hypothetical protein [Shigella flexneri]EFY9108878.1 hypothetical protein [Shigella sonnei]EFV8869879.1 hypothetical protein [Shigella dysenteriae]